MCVTQQIDGWRKNSRGVDIFSMRELLCLQWGLIILSASEGKINSMIFLKRKNRKKVKEKLNLPSQFDDFSCHSRSQWNMWVHDGVQWGVQMMNIPKKITWQSSNLKNRLAIPMSYTVCGGLHWKPLVALIAQVKRFHLNLFQIGNVMGV